MPLHFQHGNGKNAYDQYMGHTNGKELSQQLFQTSEANRLDKWTISISNIMKPDSLDKLQNEMNHIDEDV